MVSISIMKINFVKDYLNNIISGTFILSTASILFLFFTIVYFYDFLRTIAYPYSIYVPETFLAFSISLSCSLYENRIGRRVLSCLLIALVGYFLSSSLRMIMIFGIFISVSLICGIGNTNFTILKTGILKIVRAIIACIALIIGFNLPLPHGGGAGTGFTENHYTFLLIVFLPVLSLLIFDSIINRNGWSVSNLD